MARYLIDIAIPDKSDLDAVEDKFTKDYAKDLLDVFGRFSGRYISQLNPENSPIHLLQKKDNFCRIKSRKSFQGRIIPFGGFAETNKDTVNVKLKLSEDKEVLGILRSLERKSGDCYYLDIWERDYGI